MKSFINSTNDPAAGITHHLKPLIPEHTSITVMTEMGLVTRETCHVAQPQLLSLLFIKGIDLPSVRGCHYHMLPLAEPLSGN